MNDLLALTCDCRSSQADCEPNYGVSFLGSFSSLCKRKGSLRRGLRVTRNIYKRRETLEQAVAN